MAGSKRRATVGGLLLVALLAPLLPLAGPGAQAKQEIEVDQFTVVDKRNDQLHPRIDDDLVVWQDYRDVADRTGDDVNADIYALRLDDDDEIRIADGGLASRPDVSGDVVVYADARNGDRDIRAHDVRRDDSFWVVRRNGSDQDRPAISGKLVVWQDNRDGNWDIRGENLETGEEFWVSHREDNQTGPRISGRTVVWVDDRDGCCDIYARNLDTGDVVKVSEDNDAHEADVSGEWVVYRRGDGDRATIHAYNLETKERLRLNDSRDDERRGVAISGRLVIWSDRRNEEDYNLIGYDLDSRTEFVLSRADGDQTGPAVSRGRVVWVDTRGDRGTQIRGATVTLPSPTPAPGPTPSPTPQAGACTPASQLPGAPRDARYFPQTGYRIDNDTIWNYFNYRGGVRNFGFPVSRTIQFMGFPTQFFQRQVVQVTPGGAPQLLNLLDPDLMPATRINFSTYPGVDPNIKAETPPVTDPRYASKIISFTASVAPDVWQGLPVRFFSTFMQQVTLQDAFPGGGNPALLPLLNLELSGAPISYPQADPTNGNFVYQRFQRTILHYDAGTNVTQPVLLADYFKDVITGRAPVDLMDQMAGSRFISQYNPAQPLGLNRPEVLPNTNLCGAFERQ